MRNMIDSYGDLRPVCAFDLETRIHEDAEEYIEKHKWIDAPSNYKNEEAIEKYKTAARKKELDRAALYIPTHRIWVACLHDLANDKTYEFANDDEYKVIEELFHLLDTDLKNHVLFGFNTRTFDFPALCGAALRNGISRPIHLRDSSLRSDILDDFYHTKIRLKELGYVMGEKKLMDGSEVADEWKAYCMGDVEAEARVTAYCHQDVAICSKYVELTYE